jgi:hypothetical protein
VAVLGLYEMNCGNNWGKHCGKNWPPAEEYSGLQGKQFGPIKQNMHKQTWQHSDGGGGRACQSGSQVSDCQLNAVAPRRQGREMDPPSGGATHKDISFVHRRFSRHQLPPILHPSLVWYIWQRTFLVKWHLCVYGPIYVDSERDSLACIVPGIMREVNHTCRG